jgi:dTDP-glucose 4,6-dehydratase
MNDLAEFNGKTVLVAGGLGFIGSNFMRALFNASPNVHVICFDKQTYSGNPANIDDLRMRYQFTKDSGQLIEIQGDIAVDGDLALAFAYQPDYVINFAAETHVDRSIHVGSIEFINTNVIGVYNILEQVKKTSSVKKYLQVSTDEVYGQLPNPNDIPDNMMETVQYKVEPYFRSIASREVAKWMKFNRNSPFKPNVPYSATKASGDCLCNAYHHTWKLPVVVTHCSNNYGPYQYPEKMVPYWATRLLKGEKIPMYGDGLNIRDWIHVDDHITALGAVLLRGEPGKDYLIGADNERTNLEMAQIIIQNIHEIKGDDKKFSINIEEHIEFVADRPGHDRRYAIDHSDITKELGWEPMYGRKEFDAKIKESLVWYSEHVSWMQEIIKRTGVANAHIDLWKGVM